MYLGQRRGILLGITIFSVFLLTSFIANQSYATHNPDTEPIDPVVSFKGGAITVEYKECIVTDTDTVVCTWTVANNSNKNAISHVVIDLSSCTEYLTGTNPPTPLIISLDPTTGVTGIKWEEGPARPDSQDFQVVFTLTAGVLLLDDIANNAEHYEIGVKAAKSNLSGPGAGPLCVNPEINITSPPFSVKWGETASVSGTAANFEVTSTITIDWGDDTTDTIIDPATEDWGPVTHEYADDQSGLLLDVTATLNLNSGSVSDTLEDNPVTIHTTSLNEPVIPPFAKWAKIFTVSNTLTDSDAGVCTGAVSCPSSISGEDITYTGSAIEGSPVYTSPVSGEDLVASQNTDGSQDVTADFAGKAAYTPATAFSLMEIDKHDTAIFDLDDSATGATGKPVSVIGTLIDIDDGNTGISFKDIVITGSGSEYTPSVGDPVAMPDTVTGGVIIQDSDGNEGLLVEDCDVCIIEGGVFPDNNIVRLEAGDVLVFEREVAYVTLNVEDSKDLEITVQVEGQPPVVVETDIDAAGSYLTFGPNVSQITILSVIKVIDEIETETELGLIRIIGTNEEANIKIIDEGLSEIAAATYEEIAVGGGSFGTGMIAQEDAASGLEVIATFFEDDLYNFSTASAFYDLDENLQGDGTELGFGALVNVVADSGLGISGAICGTDVDTDAICVGWEVMGVNYKIDKKTYRIGLLPLPMSDTVPNIMLEIDWMEDHMPDATAIQDVIDVFDDNGITLTVFLSDEIPHVTPLNVWTDTDSDVTNDFNNIKANFYGNSTFRSNATDQSTIITGSSPYTLTVSDILVDTPPDPAILTVIPTGFVDITQGTITIKSKVTTSNTVMLSVPSIITKPATTADFSWFGKVTASVLPIPGTEHIVSIKIPFRTTGALTNASLPSLDVVITVVNPGTVGATTDTNSPIVMTKFITAYSQVVRYVVFGHSMGGASGTAEFLGNDAAITLGEGFGERDAGHAGTEGTNEEQSGTLMHEIGHWLGLKHGGPEKIKSTGVAVADADENCKPNYNSIMTYSKQTPAYLGSNWILDYSHGDMSSLTELHLNEAVGFKTSSVDNDRHPFVRSDGRVRIPFSTSTLDLPIALNYQKNADNMEPNVAVDINNFGIPGCNTASISATAYHDYDDWNNLQYNFRDTVSGQYDAATAIYPTTISDLSFSFNRLALLQAFTLDTPIMNSPPNEESNAKKGSKLPLKMPLFFANGTDITNAAVHGEWIRVDNNDNISDGDVVSRFGDRFLQFDGNSGFYSINWQIPRQTGTYWVTMFVTENESDNSILDIPATPDFCSEALVDPTDTCATFRVNVLK